MNNSHCVLIIASPSAKHRQYLFGSGGRETVTLPPFEPKGVPMDLSIKSFRYNEDLEQVQVGLAGDLGQGLFQIAIQFPFRAEEPPQRGIRQTALLVAQQILQIAAATSLPSLLAADVSKLTQTKSDSWKSSSSPWSRGGA
jgi:hypothetical protein